MIVLVVALLLFQGIQSAPWSPVCPHECWCHESYITSVSEGWQPHNSTSSNITDDLFRTAICVQQHDSDIGGLLDRLSSQTEALKIIQAPDAPEISLTSAHFSKFEHLRALSLEGVENSNQSKITLRSDSFQRLPELQYLSLANIVLLDAPSSKAVVETIEFSVNSSHPLLVYEVPEDLPEIIPYEEFKKLQESANRTTWTGFTPLKRLEYLHIRGCTLPEAFSRSHSGAFAGLNHLKELIVRSSELRFMLATELDDLSELESLVLSDNNLLDLRAGDVRGMGGLHSLDLSGNQLTRLTENTFPLLSDLESLDLSRNPLQTIYSNAFANVTSIKRLLIGCWNDEEMCTEEEEVEETIIPIEIQADSFNGLTRLRELWIGGCQLSDGLGPSYLKDLHSLSELHIRGQLTSIEADTFSANRRLQILDLKSSQLRRLSVDAFLSLSKLRTLDLSANELDQLPHGVFDPLVSLRELWLSGNRLTTVPSSIFSALTTTKLIRLEGNPWHCTCQLSQLKAAAVNKVPIFDVATNRTSYQYEKRVAPLCTSPEALKGASVFDVIRKPLRCNKVVEKLPGSKSKLAYENDIWIEPFEVVDHGPEATDDQETTTTTTLNASESSSLSDHENDIIDHGEEVIEEDTTTEHQVTTVSKHFNDVLAEPDNDDAAALSQNFKTSVYAAPSISKKALKLMMEQQLKKSSMKKYR